MATDQASGPGTPQRAEAPGTAAPPASGAAASPAAPVVATMRAIVTTGDRTEVIDDRDRLAALLADPASRAWIDVTSPSNEDVADVASLLHLHPLIAEDISESNQRAKVEEIDGVLHVVMFWITHQDTVDELEVDIVLGPQTLLTVHEAGWDPFRLGSLRGDPGALLRRGPDFLLYAVTDGIVDGYFPVLDAIEDEIDDLQADVIRRASTSTMERLFALKRELVGLRRAMSPAREIFNQLTNRQLVLVAPEHVIYFRDVYDHLIRVTDELDNDRELVAGTLDVYLSTINNNLSLIMKRLTGVTVIIAGIGAVGGIFGMSEAGTAFKGLEAAGFWIVTLGVVAGAAVTAVVLRRIDWL